MYVYEIWLCYDVKCGSYCEAHPKQSEGRPWWSSDWGSMPPLQGAQVPSLIRELRLHKPRGMAKEKPKTNKQKI